MTDGTLRAGYLLFVFLSVTGIYLMLSHRNFMKALIGLNIFQVAIILFYIVLAAEPGATIPIQRELPHDSTPEGESHAPKDGHQSHHKNGDHNHHPPSSLHYDPSTNMHNPLPHALMLTAIVVGVATQGVGLAILRRINQENGSIEDLESDFAGGADR